MLNSTNSPLEYNATQTASLGTTVSNLVLTSYHIGSTINHSSSLFPTAVYDDEDNDGSLLLLNDSSLNQLLQFGSNSLPPQEQPVQIQFTCFAMFCVLLIATTIAGNVLVILAFTREASLQAVTNYWIISLALTDIILAATVMPQWTFVEICGGRWLLGPIACDILLSIDVLCSTCSIYHLGLISLDRFLCVRFPFSYPQRRTKKTAVLAIAFTWLFCWLISSPSLFGWQVRSSRHSSDQLCLMDNMSYMILSSIISFYLPLATIVAMYLGIYRTTRQQAAKVLSLSSSVDVDLVCNTSVDQLSLNCQGKSSKATIRALMAMHRKKKAALFGKSGTAQHPSLVPLFQATANGNGVSQQRASIQLRKKPSDVDSGLELSERLRNPLRHTLTFHVALHPALTGIVSFDPSSANDSRRSDDATAVAGDFTAATAVASDEQLLFDNTPSSVNTRLSVLVDTPMEISGINNNNNNFNLTSFGVAEDFGSCVNKHRLSQETPGNNKTKTISSGTRTSGISSRSGWIRKLLRRILGNEQRSPKKSLQSEGSMSMSSNYRFTSAISRSRQKQEQRAARVVVIILSVFILFWAPFFIVNIVDPTIKPMPDYVWKFVTWFGYANSAVNPFLYTFFNRAFRRSIFKLLHIKRVV